jgi:shikimate dehydrogenase
MPPFYAVIGNPIEHSRSPWIHAQFAKAFDIVMHYDKLALPPDGFTPGLAQLQAKGLVGCNVTLPFKAEAFALAHHTTERARLARAANTLWVDKTGAWHADNTDGLGLVRDITLNADWPIEGRRILLLGAGGASAGVLAPLLACKPKLVCVANRNPVKSHDLVKRFVKTAALSNSQLQAQSLHWACAEKTLETDDAHEVFDLVINATSSSLQEQAIALPRSRLADTAFAYDMMYGPAAAAFLQPLAAHGVAVRDGLGMLVEQAAESFQIWHGVRPPSAQVLAELRALLAASP